MSDSFNLYTLLTLLACLFAGILFAWLLYQKTSHLDQRLRYALAATRAIVFAAIAALLFFPLIRSISYNLQKPIIIIGQDNSLSIDHIEPAGFDKKQYEQDLNSLANHLSDKYEVKIYNFSDSVRTGFDFKNKGKLTNGANFIAQLNDQLLNRNVGAVILASDGIFNRGGSPLYDINKLKAPVYTIALGDTIPKKDVMIANVNHNNIVYLDNEFTIEVQVQAFESKGESTTISVLENGNKVYEARQQIGSNPFVKNIPVKLKATKLGIQKYTISLSAVSNEISIRNNSEDIFIEVIDARQKVLIAAASPHPDIAVLKQAIALNKYYDLKVVLGEELNAVNPADFGLIILYQLPSSQTEPTAFFNKLKTANVSVWHILGAQSNLNAFNRLQDGVEVRGNTGTLQEAFSAVNPNFTAFDLDAASVKVLETFDPLVSPFGSAAIKGDAAIVFNQRIGKIKTQYPQLFFMANNGKKTGYLVGEGIWRWKLAEAQEGLAPSIVNSLVLKTTQYLSVKDDKRKFRVYTAKNTFDENENIIINAVLYNDSYVSVNTADVNVQVKNSAGKAYNFLFSRTESAYQLDAGTLPSGNYSYVASTTLGKNKYTAQGVFYINTLVAEYQQTIANHQLLNAMSVQTNGRLYRPQDINQIQKAIESNEQIKTLSYEDRKYEELINYKWLFIMIMLLLAMEWFFRKRNGEV
ncbi:hypothetical protein [Pedobacter metabolipauper]|uniref:VWA domain-containing protein n=1 Tax=Pedobacter metabolipauper TaxID=425513 RepID=A0A4R6SSE2_9SPHI|nr:hypothetical protein [Pedobacter metabolipauper]TDQ07533.1 hypothetical protein ATK78_3660 [Pedobacter metabolipauper]